MAVRTKGEFALACYKNDGFKGKFVKRYFPGRSEAHRMAELLILAGQFKSIIALEGDLEDERWVEFNRFSEAKMARAR